MLILRRNRLILAKIELELNYEEKNAKNLFRCNNQAQKTVIFELLLKYAMKCTQKG